MARICHVSSVHPWNDTRIFLKMCSSLAAQGHQVVEIVLEQGDAIPNGDHNGVEVVGVTRGRIRNRLGRATIGVYRVLRAAMEKQPDIIHLHDPELIPWIPYLRLRGVKVIFDAHEDFVAQNASRHWATGWRKIPIAIIAKSLRMIVNLSANHIITATETIAEQHPPERTTVVNNYPIEGELAVGAAEMTPLSIRPKRAIYIGGMNEIRGLVEVVDAAGKCEELEGLDLVGTFESDAFRDRLATLPGWQKVKAHGQCGRIEVKDLLSQARFGIVTFHPLPNHVDAKPNKLFEYMSAGLPVLHSDFPLWRSLSDAPSRGLAADPEDPEAIARGMRELLTRTDLDDMGARAAQSTRDIFNWRVETVKLVSVVESLSKT